MLTHNQSVLAVIGLSFLAGAALADVVITTFNPTDVFIDTSNEGIAQLNAAVGVVGCAFEEFEDTTLTPGITIAYENGAPSSTFKPEDLDQRYPDALWDGSACFLPTVRDTGNVLLPMTISLDTPVPTIGIGLGDIESPVEFIVNGQNFGLITDMPGYDIDAPDNAREIYIRADASNGELISSITLNPVDTGVGDGVFVDHFAFGTPRESGEMAHYWPLDAMVDDLVGGSLGTFVGVEDWRLGKYGYGSAFSGSSYITTDWAPSISAGGSFSFAVWFRHESAPDAVYYPLGLERGGSQQIGLVLNGNDDTLQVYFRDDGWNQVPLRTPWTDTNDGQWHHVVGVLDGDAGMARMYIDGILATSESVSLGNINVSNPLTIVIGASNHDGGIDGPFPGDLDDLRFYDRALTAADVRMLCPHACRGDFNADGVRNTVDFIHFLNTWNGGCP